MGDGAARPRSRGHRLPGPVRRPRPRARAAGEALAVLRGCPCREEGVAACHRCLLPHVAAAPRRPTPAARSAIDLLDEVLAHWEPRPIETITRIAPDLHDTPIEMRFRTLLLRWAKARGAAADHHRDRAWATARRSTSRRPSATGAGSSSRRSSSAASMPDFVLTSADPQVPKIAVFCDSRRWHCSPEANRLADDADKRAGAARPGLPGVGGHAPRPRRLRRRCSTASRPHRRPWSATPLRVRCSSRWRRRWPRRAASRPTPCSTDAVSLLTAFLLRPVPDGLAEPRARAGGWPCATGQPTRTRSTRRRSPTLLRAEFGEDVDVPAGHGRGRDMPEPARRASSRSTGGRSQDVRAVDRRRRPGRRGRQPARRSRRGTTGWRWPTCCSSSHRAASTP